MLQNIYLAITIKFLKYPSSKITAYIIVTNTMNCKCNNQRNEHYKALKNNATITVSN